MKSILICVLVLTWVGKSAAQGVLPLKTEGTLPGGVRYVINEKSTAPPSAKGMIMVLAMTSKMSVGGKVVTNRFSANDPVPLEIGGMSPLPEQFSQVLDQLAKGDSITFYESVDTMLLQNPSLVFDKGSEVIYGCRVLDIMTESEYSEYEEALEIKRETMARQDVKIVQSPEQIAKEDQLILGYLRKNNLKAKKLASGLYVQVIKPGSGAVPQFGDNLVVHYTFKTLDGQVHDSSIDKAPIEFLAGLGLMIAGFDEGVMQFKSGGKGVIYIPSRLAYGTGGVPPHNSVLVYEIELIKVEPKGR
jgi:FKBP-type peptidyl-prolyl cis-trans isomerase FkpA